MHYSLDKKILNGGFYQLEYPASYSFLNEGGGEIVGFLLSPPNTAGVLRLSVYTFQDIAVARKIFESGFEKVTTALRIDVNGLECMFYVEEKKFGSNDYLFWRDSGEPISMYFYTVLLECHMFMFSYRIPVSMEENGIFDSEHPEIMRAIGSLQLK